jgi:CBS domain containing-hemolysin-like protein
VAGAQARALFGESSLLWFSAVFTLGVLFLSEIIPKIAGVAYNRPVSRFVSGPLALTIRVLFPLVWVSQKISWLLTHGPASPMAPEEEVHQMARMSAEEGSILPVEAELVKNVLHLDSLRAKDIMTPRSVVYRLSADLSVEDVSRAILDLPHARIPLHSEEDPEDWTGVVLRTTILCELARDRFQTKLGKLAKPLTFVPDSIRGDQLLTHFLVRRQHLAGVVDEYGSVVGIVSLEDVLESLLGSEIVDETDSVVDMREAARTKKRKGKAAPSPPPSTPPKA